MTSSARRLLEFGSGLVRVLPIDTVSRGGEFAGRVAARRRPDQRRILRENLRQVLPDAEAAELDELVVDGFGSYGRYWAETLRLPSLSADAIDRRFDVVGYENIQESLSAGFGPIMVLPHLGGWEWAAAWLGRVAELPVSAVVERLEPDDVFEWFTDLRSSYGVNVIPLGPAAMGDVVKAVKDKHVVCLLADRDIGDSGTTVEFFGAAASLPIGPALLSRRTGAPTLPTAVYFEEGRHLCRVGKPLWPIRTGDFRADLQAMTERNAAALEDLIKLAPEQWHVLEPIWADDSPVEDDTSNDPDAPRTPK